MNKKRLDTDQMVNDLSSSAFFQQPTSPQVDKPTKPQVCTPSPYKALQIASCRVL